MPAPLRPVMTVRPGPSRTSAAEYVRKSRSAEATRRAAAYTLSLIGIRRYWNPEPSAASISPGRSGEISAAARRRLHRLQAVAQELRVEADLQRLAGERDRDRLARLADVRRARRHRQLTLGEREPQRRVLLRQQRDAPHDLGDLAAGEPQLVLVGVRQQLAVVRELAVDQPRGEHDAADREDDLVGAHGDAQRLGVLVLDDPGELLQRPRRHVGLEGAGQRRLELGLLDAQAVGVGRDHPQLVAGGRDEDAGQHRARLVARGRAGDLGRPCRRTPRPAPRRIAVGLREGREVLEPQRADVEGRGAAEDLDVLLDGPQLERDLVAGQRADDVHDQPRRQDDRALADDLAVEGDAQADLHVGGPELDAVLGGEQLHAGERLDRAAGGRRAGDGLQLSEERVAPSGDLHAAAASRVEIG